MSISKKFNIELRYANQESAPGIHALAQELSSRGHSVTTKSTSSRIPNIDDITRSAANLKGIAETGVQILKDTIDSFVSKATDVKGSEKTDDRDAPKTDANGFDTIGPQGDQTEQNAKANESTDDNSAIVVTSQSCLNDAKWDAMRIGLIAEFVGFSEHSRGDIRTLSDRPQGVGFCIIACMIEEYLQILR